MRPFITILIYLCSISFTVYGQSTSDARVIYDQMMAAMGKVKSATFTIDIKERIYGKTQHGIHHVKLQVKPLKIYLKSEKPDAGAEVLYVEGTNNNKALVNPNTFPFINVNLSPSNPLLRKHHHYTILQMGFAHAFGIMRYYETTEGDRFYRKLKIGSDPTNKFHILEIDNDEFGFINYKVGKGENVTDIANKFRVNDQMILELNKNISDFNDVSTGQVITIPNSFGRRIVMHIDKKTMLPLKQLVYDLKGLYSQVEFKSLRVNPTFTDMDFNSENTQYGF